jgi:hypothetical protein
MYEIRGTGVRRFLFAPFAGTLAVITILSVVLFGEGGWFLLAARSGWRGSSGVPRASGFAQMRRGSLL